MAWSRGIATTWDIGEEEDEMMSYAICERQFTGDTDV